MITRKRLGVATVALWISLTAGVVGAQVIDFETIPGGTPVDGLPISTQFLASHGIEFQLEGGGVPVLAEVGSPTTAFRPNDNPDEDQGSFFLTDDGSLSNDAADLLVLYDTPTANASGVILDIDGTEIFTIEARNAANEVVATQVIEDGDPLTGDRNSTPWSITRPAADIFSIRFSGERPGGGVFGLGFDDFSARGDSTCARAVSVACLLDDRFEVSVRTWDFSGTEVGGVIQTYGGVTSETDQSVSFYGFQEGNVEVFVKMVDACAFSSDPAQNSFWLFAAGATNAEVEITVRDTETGEMVVIDNPSGRLFETFADTRAFLGCP